MPRRMTPDDREKVTDLCRRCKFGYVPTPNEMRYLERMHATYPNDYTAISKETQRWATKKMNPLARDDGEE